MFLLLLHQITPIFNAESNGFVFLLFRFVEIVNLIHIGHTCESLTHLNESSGATPLLGSHEALEDEIKRLRERLHTVENENVALNSKLSQQQWELENRLADIEMQLCGASSASSIDHEEVDVEDVERNRESII